MVQKNEYFIQKQPLKDMVQKQNGSQNRKLWSIQVYFLKT